MSRWGGGEGGCQNVTNTTDRLRECVTKGGRGSKKTKKLRDVIYGWSLPVTSHQAFASHPFRCEIDRGNGAVERQRRRHDQRRVVEDKERGAEEQTRTGLA